jgi:hypothetical protein
MPSAERMEFSEFSLDFEGLQWRRGGGSNIYVGWGTEPRGSHSEIFFSSREFWEARKRNSRVVQRPRPAQAAFISCPLRMPGAVKSPGPFHPGPAPSRHKLFREFREIFFGPGGGKSSQPFDRGLAPRQKLRRTIRRSVFSGTRPPNRGRRIVIKKIRREIQGGGGSRWLRPR